jgi:peptidoglycan/LPS O-acetylase OafA/YrhL
LKVSRRRFLKLGAMAGAGVRFTRHLLEMVVAMIAGMAVLGVAIGVLGEPPGYANPLVEYGLMGAFMSAPVVAWMRCRGHSWSDGLEMTAAMLVPMLALVLPAEFRHGCRLPHLPAGTEVKPLEGQSTLILAILRALSDRSA